MSIRLEKPFTPLSEEALKNLPGQTGVFQLADQSDNLLAIGFAGGRSLFGIRSELPLELERLRAAGFQPTSYRLEVNTAYLTRFQELLMLHLADFGELPVGQADHALKLGRLSPG